MDAWLVFLLMAVLPVLDLVDGRQSLLLGAGPGLLVGALFAILLTGQALLGVLHKAERRVWYLELDAVLLLLAYGAGLYLVYPTGH